MKYANGSLYIFTFLFWIGPEQKRNGASHPVSYLANLHRAVRANPLLILCLVSYCPYALNPENQRDVDVVELKETGTQPGVEVWFVEGTVVIDDWADTIARRGQVCRCRESAFPERSHLSPERSHLSPDGGSLSRAAVHRLAADGYDSAADNASSLNVAVEKTLGKRR